MSVKRAFFSVFQKIMVICCAMFFGFADAFAANLPSGYTELEYIESTGTQWIDTGIKGNMSYKYEIDFQQIDSGQYRKWGAFNQQSYSGGPNMSFTYSSGFSVRWTVSGNQVQQVDSISAINANRHKIIIDNGNVTWDGVSKGRSTGHQDNYQLNYNLFLGTINPGGTTPTTNAKSKYYSYKVWNTDGNLIQNFIPAKNSSGVVGMYDTVSGTFFTNAGTGTFAAGPVVPENPIRIATTAYNTAQFNPVVTELNTTIATIRDVVTNTINQTKAIADLQATKQTRPDEQCPAGKKCLLVETEENGVIVPHWFPIIEAPEE